MVVIFSRSQALTKEEKDISGCSRRPLHFHIVIIWLSETLDTEMKSKQGRIIFIAQKCSERAYKALLRLSILK